MSWKDNPLFEGKDQRERFLFQAQLLWARGMPPPTSEEIADAMMEVLDTQRSEFRIRHAGTGSILRFASSIEGAERYRGRAPGKLVIERRVVGDWEEVSE